MIKAIETTYRGYRFRSRLEARWAVFFDTLGVPYEYEKEGFDLDGVVERGWNDEGIIVETRIGSPVGFYLPDFWLPDQGCFIEIKPSSPSMEEIDRAIALAQQSGHNAYIFHGEIPMSDEGASESALACFSEGCDSCHGWVACSRCGKRGIVFGGPGFIERLCDCGTFEDSQKIVDRAVVAARGARFEHGERGPAVTRRSLR